MIRFHKNKISDWLKEDLGVFTEQFLCHTTCDLCIGKRHFIELTDKFIMLYNYNSVKTIIYPKDFIDHSFLYRHLKKWIIIHNPIISIKCMALYRDKQINEILDETF